MESGARQDDRFLRPYGEISPAEIVAILWRRRWLLTAITIAGCVFAAVAALLVPKKFEATVLLAPVTAQQGGIGALGSVASQLGGLASLAGISLSAPVDGKAESVATMQSSALTQRYIHENSLLPVLFSKDWDGVTKKWNTKRPRTLWLANKFFAEEIRSVREDTKTGLITLTIKWTDPDLAAQWANGIVALTNTELRDKAIAESRRAIAYLNEQLGVTNTVELRNAIYSLMRSEIEKEMLARGRDEYALKVVDSAVAPEKQSSPLIRVWMLGGGLIGFVLAAALALVRGSR